MKLPDLTSQKTQPVSQNPETTGSAIKKNIKSVLSKKYGELDTRNLFNDIDDKDIEDNIRTAENTIKTNVDRGALSKNILPKLPNLRGGLALSYAAANKGNSKAATRAREAAYTEGDMLLENIVENKLLSNDLPEMQNTSDNQLTSQSSKHSSFYDDYLKNKEPSKNNSNLWNEPGKAIDLPEVKKKSSLCPIRCFEYAKRSRH